MRFSATEGAVVVRHVNEFTIYAYRRTVREFIPASISFARSLIGFFPFS
jgi:hypothetical protein